MPAPPVLPAFNVATWVASASTQPAAPGAAAAEAAPVDRFGNAMSGMKYVAFGVAALMLFAVLSGGRSRR